MVLSFIVAVSVKPEVGGKPQARTRLARAAVVEAARELFAERGYAATTMEALSARASVPSATMYRLFGSKIGVLKTMLDLAAVGDDEPVAFGDRPGAQAMLALEDPRELLDAFGEITPVTMSRLAPVNLILTGAATTDPEAAELLAEHVRQRQHGQGRIAARLARLGALRESVSQRRAADIIHALSSPEVYRLLTVDRGWSGRQFGDWLAETLKQQLLA